MVILSSGHTDWDTLLVIKELAPCAFLLKVVITILLEYILAYLKGFEGKVVLQKFGV